VQPMERRGGCCWNQDGSSQPRGIGNHNLTFKPGFYRVFQNIAPPAIVSPGRRPREGAFLFGEKIKTSNISRHTALARYGLRNLKFELNNAELRNSFYFKKNGAKRSPQIFNLQFSIPR
jgi:hypothetical protein